MPERLGDHWTAGCRCCRSRRCRASGRGPRGCPWPTCPRRRRASAAFFSVRRRASAMISAITSSTTLRVLEYGALNTAMPRSAAAARSTWLVPMQNAADRQQVRGRVEHLLGDRGSWSGCRAAARPSSAATSSSSSRAPLTRLDLDPALARAAATASGWMFSSSSAFMGPRRWCSRRAEPQCRKADAARPAILSPASVGRRQLGDSCGQRSPRPLGGDAAASRQASANASAAAPAAG